ncbi:hypothetical protein BJF78_24600 [Pseudonocardia sp. CNS-139]|nr:hypothetical protein BJF78_24600 [Pseudonocardia sp. CNS-139]
MSGFWRLLAVAAGWVADRATCVHAAAWARVGVDGRHDPAAVDQDGAVEVGVKVLEHRYRARPQAVAG